MPFDLQPKGSTSLPVQEGTMAQVAILHRYSLLQRLRIFKTPALLVTILLVSSVRCLASSGTPGYGTVNLAQGKPVTAITGTALGSVAGVNDGSTAGYWYSYDGIDCASIQLCSSSEDSSYYFYTSFTIDLQAEYAIGRVNIYPLQTRGLRVLSSLDGTHWTEQHKFDGYEKSGLLTTSIGSVTFEPQGSFTARYLKYQGWAWWNQYVGVDEFEVFEWMADSPSLPSIGSLPNLAAGQQATNSGGTTTPGHDAFPNLTDGDPFTSWQSEYYFDNCQYVYNDSICPVGHWFNDFGGAYVDLGSAKPIQAIRLSFPTDIPATQSYIIDISDDVNNNVIKWWTFGGDPKVIASLPPITNSATKTFYLPSPITARYVWVSLSNWTTSQPLLPGLAEIEVYGELSSSSTYTISATADPNGLINPAGSVTVNSGESQTFTITPHTGYQVHDVRVDGVSVGPVTTYSFPNVAADHTIYATFSLASETSAPTVTVIPAASSVTTAQSLMVTITVSGGSEKPIPTGTVVLASGSYSSVAISLVGGQATLSIPAGSLAVGDDTLTASYTPDASSSVYSASTGVAHVTVTPAPPAATLSSTSLSFSTSVGATSAAQNIQLSNTGGSALTISAVTLSGSGATAFAQSNNCGTSLAMGATCSFVVTFSPSNATNYSATLSIADNAADSPQSVSLSGAGLSFTVAASPGTQTVLPAQAAVFAVSVSSQNGSFSNAVTLSASGLPAGATALFSPASVTPGSSSGYSTLTIVVPWSVASVGDTRHVSWPVTVPFLALVLPFLGGLRRTGKRFIRTMSVLLFVLAGTVAGLGIIGCDSTTGFFAQQQKSYVVTITGTSGTLARSSTVTLTVQ
jgi:hypothetical protein